MIHTAGGGDSAGTSRGTHATLVSSSHAAAAPSSSSGSLGRVSTGASGKRTPHCPWRGWHRQRCIQWHTLTGSRPVCMAGSGSVLIKLNCDDIEPYLIPPTHERIRTRSALGRAFHLQASNEKRSPVSSLFESATPRLHLTQRSSTDALTARNLLHSPTSTQARALDSPLRHECLRISSVDWHGQKLFHNHYSRQPMTHRSSQPIHGIAPMAQLPAVQAQGSQPVQH